MNLKPIKSERGFKTARKFACSTSGCNQTFVLDKRRVGNVKCPVCSSVQRITR